MIAQWMDLINIITCPGKLNKTIVGDLINGLMAHLDGEILPIGNSVVRELQSLKMIMAQSSTVTNAEVVETLARTLGPALTNDLTTGRILSKKGTVRDDVGENFNFWKRSFCFRFPERATVDLALESDRHKVAGWNELFGPEAKRKG